MLRNRVGMLFSLSCFHFFFFFYRGHCNTLCNLSDRDTLLVALCPCAPVLSCRKLNSPTEPDQTGIRKPVLCPLIQVCAHLQVQVVYQSFSMSTYDWNNKPLKKHWIICTRLRTFLVHVIRVLPRFCPKVLEHTPTVQTGSLNSSWL